MNWNPFTTKPELPVETPSNKPPPTGLNRLVKVETKRKYLLWIAVGAAVVLVAGGSYATYRLTRSKSSDNTVNPSLSQSSNSSTSSTSPSHSSSSKASTPSTSSHSSSSSSSSGGSSVSGPGAASFSSPIGFVGCSNSRDTVLGYHADGGTKLWTPPATAYGGGTVLRWTTDTKYWSGFDSLNAADPGAKVVWWSLCTYTVAKGETDSADYTAALSIIATLKQKIPGVAIYASALNTYVAPHICGVTGADGPSRMQSLVDRLVSEGRVSRGPVVGSLLSIYPTNVSAGATAANNQTQTDGCHPNDIGKTHLGQSLVNFFGK